MLMYAQEPQQRPAPHVVPRPQTTPDHDPIARSALDKLATALMDQVECGLITCRADVVGFHFLDADSVLFLPRPALGFLPWPSCQPPGGGGIRTVRPYRGAMSTSDMVCRCSSTCRSCARPRARSQAASLGGSFIPPC